MFPIGATCFTVPVHVWKNQADCIWLVSIKA